jgi:uncharacterized protein YjfI (DUF2170 family)
MGKNKQARQAESRKVKVEASIVAVAEHEKKLEVIQDQVGKISLKITALQRTQRVASLSTTQIEQIDAGKFYSQLGKMFLLSDKEQVVRDLKESANNAGEELPRLLKTYNQFNSLRQEQTDAIKELYNSIKATG